MSEDRGRFDPGGASNDPQVIQIRELRQDIAELRRWFEGEKHEPDRGVFRRMGRMENRLDSIEEAREEEVVNRRINATFRKAWVAGFTCLGILSALIIGILARILSIIAGG